MIPSICINLAHRQDKWEAVQKEFVMLGVEPIKFDAILGEGDNKRQRGRNGCTRSHLACMEKMVSEGVFMILEDDILGCVDIPFEVLKSALEELPVDGWDALYLGANIQKPLDKYSRHLYHLEGGLTTHAIIWNNQNGVVDDILANPNKELAFDDWMVEIQEKRNIFIAYPMILTQRQWDSDIAHRTDASVLCRNAGRHMEYFNYIKE